MTNLHDLKAETLSRCDYNGKCSYGGTTQDAGVLALQVGKGDHKPRTLGSL